MAKHTLALLLVAALVACASASLFPTPRRSLQQAPGFTCAQAKQLKGRCSELFDCVVKAQPSLKNVRPMGLRLCESCVTATSSCTTASAPLPSQCRQGLSFAPIVKCINAAAAAQAKPATKPAGH